MANVTLGRERENTENEIFIHGVLFGKEMKSHRTLAVIQY